MDGLGSQWRRRAQSPPSCVSVGRGVASWAQGESQVSTLGAGTKRGPHPHTRTGLERAGRTANCFDPGDHSPRRGRDSRRRRLQVGWRASCWAPPRPFPRPVGPGNCCHGRGMSVPVSGSRGRPATSMGESGFSRY